MPQRPPAAFRPQSQVEDDGSAFSNGVAVTQVVAIHGSTRFKSRIKTATGGGTLKARYVRPGEVNDSLSSLAEYDTNQPADVAIAIGVEGEIVISDLHGENYIKLEFLPSADGTFVYWDMNQL